MDDSNTVGGLFFLALIACIYLLPTIVASQRRHRNENAIGVLNVFLGWTLVGWVLALVWAFTDNTKPRREKF